LHHHEHGTHPPHTHTPANKAINQPSCLPAPQLYNLPQGGNIKLYKGLQCPLDEFELLLFQLAGSDGKTYPLCPFCYNHPPFEGVVKVGH
jgi:hypothetical protein